jgi:hypothetical protein
MTRYLSVLVLGLGLIALPRAGAAAQESNGAAQEGSSSLTTKAKAAFANITKAKTALNAGKSKTGDSYLAKAEALLKSAMGKVPGGSALAKTDTASNAAEKGNAPQTTGALSQAEGAAAKLDPSLGDKLGVAKQQSNQGDTGNASNTISDAKQSLAQKTGLSGIQDTYQKVSMARSLIKGGDSDKAKGILDQIPSSPMSLLKGL